MPLGLAMEMFGERLTTSIEKIGGMLASQNNYSSEATTPQAPGLPRVIRFPYARHSSYQELCHFVDAFKPLDVWPCTEDAQHWWRNGTYNSLDKKRRHTAEPCPALTVAFAGCSIASYFGEVCTGNDFAYDRMVQALYPNPPPPQEDDDTHDTQTSEQASLANIQPPLSSPAQRLLSDSVGPDDDAEDQSPSPPPKRARTAGQDESQDSTASHILESDSAVRWDAYNRTLDRLYDGDWDSLPLLSTTDHHSIKEQEL